jgi:hypothetical protein
MVNSMACHDETVVEQALAVAAFGARDHAFFEVVLCRS